MMLNRERVNDGKREAARRAKVLFVTPELGGYLKAGGLGEVAVALPEALSQYCDVRLVMPAFPAARRLHGAFEIIREMPGSAELPPWTLARVKTARGLTLYLVVCDALFDREGSPYCDPNGVEFPDNDVRFARFCLAAAEIAEGIADPNWKPDIVHANDWPSALTPAFMRWRGNDAGSILTIHNLAYQGLFDASRLGTLGIPQEAMCIDGVEFHGKLSFLKAGLFYASRLTTVSQTYAREITTEQHGCGLDGLLRTRSERGELTGIINGIDDSWSELAEASDGPGFVQRWKAERAERVRREFKLKATRGPLFSIISRLVHQKGVDLSIGAAEMIVRNGGQLVITGRGEPRFETAVQRLAERHPGMVAANIGFDDAQARDLYSASDFLLMPSRFEPCGLGQMYAQSQAALPIAYRTGGLADTIVDGRSGFLFDNCNEFALRRTISRSFHAHRSGHVLERMRRNALSRKYSWKGSARRYASIYQSCV